MNRFQMKPCSVILDRETFTPKAQTSLSAELHNAIEEKSLLTVRSKRKLLMDLKELQQQNIEADCATRRAKTITELITSEASYIAQLKIVEIYFMEPIKKQNILSPENYLTLFGNIHTIRNLNEELFLKLEKCRNNIAEVFLEMAPFLKVYSTYAYCYKKSLSILLSAPSKLEAFVKFLELQESRPEVQQKLSALLIAPIQRIPRYCLLLQQILDNTSNSDASYCQLKVSLQKIQEIVEHIDHLVGHQDNAQRLINLQHSLKNGFPCIIKPDRKLIKEGILRKLSEGSGRLHKKYFILLTDIIVCCDILKSNIDSANSLKCKGILPLYKCEINKLSNESFKLHCKGVEMTVVHKDANECRQWINAIQGTIKECQEHKRTLRKDSSSRRPVFGKFISEYQDLGLSPGIPRKKRQHDPNDMPATLIKRRCIRNNTEEGNGPSTSVPKIKLPEYVVGKGCDSLYPLRQRLANKSVTFQQSDTIPTSDMSDSGIYVFGNNNEDKGFHFKLSSMFNGITKSFKKLFGFKED